MSTFKPSDIKTVLPQFFNMKWNDGKELQNEGKSLNESFLESETMDILIERMEDIVKNKYFDNFYNNILEMNVNPDKDIEQYD